jgi:hypothetical protein
MTFTNPRYEFLKDIFTGQRLPLAFVDFGAFSVKTGFTTRLTEMTGKDPAHQSAEENIVFYTSEEIQ